jgi:hypothetical protein
LLRAIVLTIVEHEEPATARLVAATCYTAKGADALRRLMPILIEEYVVHEVVEKVKEHFFDVIFLSDFRRLMAQFLDLCVIVNRLACPPAAAANAISSASSALTSYSSWSAGRECRSRRIT